MTTSNQVHNELPSRTVAKFEGQKSLDGALVGGIAWTTTGKWLSLIFTAAATLIVARILEPADYGLVGMASVYIGFVTLVNESGIATVVVSKRDLSPPQIAQLNTLSVLLGVSAFAISCLAAGPLALFFRAPQLSWVVISMSAAFVLAAFKAIPYSLLQRDLQFKTLAIVEASQSLAQTLAMVAFALLGLGYWTLVLGPLTGVVISTVLLVVWVPCPFAMPRFASIRGALTFVRHILAVRVLWYGYSNADFLVAGRVLGKSALGVYTVAWDLASMVVEKITTLVGRVTPAVFSAVQADHRALRRYLLKVTQGMALITIPATLGLGLVAKEFILLTLGPKWQSSIAPLQILAAYASIRSISTLVSQVLTVTGQVRFMMYNGIFAILLMPCLFYLGSRWGPEGIAMAWILGFPVLLLPPYVRLFRTIQLHPKDYLRALWPALNGSIVMVLVVILLKRFLPESLSVAIRLALEVCVGFLSYASSIALFHRGTFRDAAQLVRNLRE